MMLGGAALDWKLQYSSTGNTPEAGQGCIGGGKGSRAGGLVTGYRMPAPVASDEMPGPVRLSWRRFFWAYLEATPIKPTKEAVN
jgi:hypothetical protein